jgi:hypothetical protein
VERLVRTSNIKVTGKPLLRVFTDNASLPLEKPHEESVCWLATYKALLDRGKSTNPNYSTTNENKLDSLHR